MTADGQALERTIGEREEEMQHVAHRHSDEVHQLRAEIERQAHHIGVLTGEMNQLEEERDRLRAENAELYRLRGAAQDVCEDLRAALTSAVDVLDEARSGFVGGSTWDIQWDDRKTIALADAKAALEQQERAAKPSSLDQGGISDRLSNFDAYGNRIRDPS